MINSKIKLHILGVPVNQLGNSAAIDRHYSTYCRGVAEVLMHKLGN